MTAVETNGSDLSVVEVAKLENLEVVIEGGLQSFIEVGRALSEIRDGRLYRASHMTFEDYCQERWGMSANYAAKHIDAATTVDVIESCTNGTDLPKNERQVRPLTRLPESERAAAWKEAVATAPEGKVTAAHVEKVVASRLPDSDEPREESEATKKKPTPERKADREAKAFLEDFHKNVAKLCDGGVYTIESLVKAVGFNKTVVHWFIRMCEVSPSVKVHRTYGKKDLVQYTFEKTHCVTGHERIRQLAEQIRDDQTAGTRAKAAAERILSLLGG